MFGVGREIQCIHDFVHTLWEMQEDYDGLGHTLFPSESEYEELSLDSHEIEAWDNGIVSEEED